MLITSMIILIQITFTLIIMAIFSDDDDDDDDDDDECNNDISTRSTL